MTVLSIRNLVTTFASPHGTARAVDGVSFDIAPGETLGLVGESGCGKSMTAFSILRLIDPPGHIDPHSTMRFEDRDLLALSPKELREVRGAGIGMVFQEPTTSLNPVLTVGFQIAETILAHEDVSKADAKARAVELLELVGIPDPAQRASSYPHELSGGMQQRVMIAIALSCRPSLLIADEPTTALDVTVQAQILDLMIDLRERFNMAMLFISHDLGVVARVADRIAVMYGGRIVETGVAADVFDRPAHPYTRGLLAAIPRLDHKTDRLEGIAGSVPNADNWPTGCRFHPRCKEVMDECRTTHPEPFAVREHHTAACWLNRPAGTDGA